MATNLQLEFLNTDSLDPAIILAGGAIPFDNPLVTTDAIEYNAATGRFTVKQAGSWIVNWFVAQQTGLSPEGSNFGVAVYNPILEGESGYPGLMEPEFIIGSGHVKISATSGFAIISVDDEQLVEGGVVFELVNTSDHDAALSERTQVKAGIAVFKSSDDDFRMAYGQWQASGWDKTLDPYNLEHEEAIKFDKSILNAYGIEAIDSGIGSRTGYDIFELEKPGVYQVSWEIPIEATDTVEAVEIILQLDGSTVYSRSYSPLPIGVVSGTAILSTTARNKTISIINLQEGDGDVIQIGNYANIAIHQIAQNLEQQQ